MDESILSLCDIRIAHGAVEFDKNNEVNLISGTAAYYQHIVNEAMTTEGDLFYDGEYGWSLIDFMHKEFDDFLKVEIEQRIIEKLEKRTEIDQNTIEIQIELVEADNINIVIRFEFLDDSKQYTIDLNIDGAEVVIND